jgi:hypothetical protein
MFQPQTQPTAPQQPVQGAGGATPAPVQDKPPVTIDDIVELLRDDRMRGFRIDVETDSLVEANQNEEKQRRVEFVTAVGEFIAKTGPIAKEMPQLAPMVGEMLKFAVRGFKAGQELEETIEKAMDAAGMALANPPQPQPSPDEMIKLKVAQVKADAEGKKAAIGVQQAQTEGQIKIQQTAMEAQKSERDHQMSTAEHHMKIYQMGLDANAALMAHERESELSDRRHAQAMQAAQASGIESGVE